MLRIRLRRIGARKRPSYRVVVAEATAPRDGRYVDQLGFYDPLTDPATVQIDAEKAREWIRKGAQPSDRVAKLLNRAPVE
ncbi:MAG: 30S ribosomal protein S16 [Chloroflexota bacterium]